MDAPPINSDTSMADINTLRLKGKTVTLTYCEGYPANEMMGILTGPDWEHEIAPADWRYVVAKRAHKALLDAGEKGGLAGAEQFLADLRAGRQTNTKIPSRRGSGRRT